jgi:hypothetical protein
MLLHRERSERIRAGFHRAKTRKAREMPEPTDALPGTAAKVLVLIERRLRGQYLWHPYDAKHNDL